MSVVDIIIIVFLALGAVIGFKRGFTRELVSLVGIFLIIVLSFLLKNPVSVILYNNLPFFNFGGIFKDITVLNILVYEIIAFIIVFIILYIIFKILLRITKIVETAITLTIILSLPSKIAGAILGLIEGFIYTFIILYILSLPVFNLNIVHESKFSNEILNKTPILHNVCDKTLNVFNEIMALKEEYKTTNNIKEYNQKTLNLMIKNGVITKENAQKLIDKGKIKNVTIE